MRGIQKQSLIEKGMIRSRKSPLYRGLTRIFIVIAVVWTGLILHWLRDEYFPAVRPDQKMMERVDQWVQNIIWLSEDSELPLDRRPLIQKALDTEMYWINGRQRRLTPAELKGCRTNLENGFSPRVKDAIARAAKNAKAGRSLARMDRMVITPAWDFRGVKGLDLENLRHAVQGTVFWLTEIQTFDGMERHFAFGIVEKYHPSGEFAGLVTEDVGAHQNGPTSAHQK